MAERIGFVAGKRREKRCPDCGAEISINNEKRRRRGEKLSADKSIGFISRIKKGGVKEREIEKEIGFLSDPGSIEETAVEPTVGFLADIPEIKYLKKTKSLEELSELKDEAYEKIRELYLTKKKADPENKEKLDKEFRDKAAQLEKEYDFIFRKIKMFQGEEIPEEDDEALNKNEVNQSESGKHPIGF